ncbi:thiamine pyrophosphate-dependent enzyme [Adlercreutzia sp. R25]|uniref:Thiamine pyrophosphate-dependent enzyme n=1 Tax=Adlercreutzia shanghongiae TaxID=3111773 RepID=A0ABU6IVL8_9ACTN|nr:MULTISPECIES: thiamine pyrophosphate-dependent enzyme [unclassified Adlercreutzia]MEC4272156.1 thiamine pyrophosphate-dependent enzyme [Adlercreutzia sp. R25]MEC4293877.1 thiamine pyrophosphate-dependent enzyme [Adlercreutzia sp. R22]
MKKLLMGNEAFAHAALEAGVNVVAGYPGTPSSELVETVAKLHADGAARDVHVEWSTNEKAALELLAGASYCGARVLFTCKQVGLNVASDALMSLNYVGAGGGCVLFVADDPGPISSQTEQDTRRFGAFAKVPVLDPSSPDEGFAMMKAAFELSERYHTPVIVRPTTRINHASTFFDVAEETHGRPLPEEGFQKDPRWIIFPKRAFEGHGEINRRLAQIAWDFDHDPAFAQFNQVVEGGGEEAATKRRGVEGAVAERDAAEGAAPEAPAVGIVTGGVSTAYAREALLLMEAEAAAAGLAVPRWRLLAVGTPYPFPAETAAAFAEGLTDVIVFEELDSVLEEEMLKLAGVRHLPLRVHGKLTGAANDRGENTTESIAGRLGRFFGRTSVSSCVEQRAGSEAPSRAGCAATGTVQWTVPQSEPLLEHEGASLPARGQTDSLAALVAATIGANHLSYEGPLPVRPPVLCAGCPHRGSFYAVKQALRGRDAVLCGDIGCYTLGNAAPLDAVDTCLCMGAGITMAQGFSIVEPGKKQVAFVGDSTFFASAMTGIANAVYNGHDVTFAILDNATTAMTGSQPHPGTGVTLMGERRRPIVIEEVLHGLGVQHIGFANPHSLEGSVAAARAAIDFEGPSAIIFRAPCIQLKKPDAPVVIDADACTGCKKCITSIGCPGIGFDGARRGPKSGERGQAFVDASLCDGCSLCVQVCPFGAIQGAPGFGGAAPVEPAVYAPDPDPFQTGPIPRVLADEVNDFQETELADQPLETPGAALGAAEATETAEEGGAR